MCVHAGVFTCTLREQQEAFLGVRPPGCFWVMRDISLEALDHSQLGLSLFHNLVGSQWGGKPRMRKRFCGLDSYSAIFGKRQGQIPIIARDMEKYKRLHKGASPSQTWSGRT